MSTGIDTGRDQDLRLVWDRIRTMVYDDNRRAEVSAEVGLSFVKVKALRRLLARPMPMRELAAQLVVDKPYMTQVVDALEQRGLVVRTVDARDRRCRIVSLTEAGRATAERSEEILTRPPAILAGLSDEDLGQLTRILMSLPATGDGEPS
ncbi:MarR family transcriptional regulator [Actinospica sp. MGRD01-02]|uniref:MarR family transcriptional regulator n=1 Tax=Actinospica acidithermotolerans TaxID=2828514 RepID=A0A941INX5_9ACTN|nr:MarR family transcriptional regulator [Actinospica acidithermotolerans]MBR7831418.1 MarR family transcriptional regulator [Actinospica acidithermotolerans]